MDFLLAFA
jgi:hypothetical protein